MKSNGALVTIFDVKYNDQGKPFVIMEYVSGPSLADLLKESPGGLGPQKAAFFLREIGKGLAFLHECGIVHRDLKPGNIFYENGYVKIGDYGLTKAISTSHQTGQDTMVGTPRYMAPEMAAGHYDHRVDIYALGAVLCEMLTGQVPFLGSSPAEILMKHMTAAPDLSNIEEPFACVIRKALAKDPTERHQSVQEMVEDVFGTEHVRNSVSQFAPQELSVMAEHLAEKRQDGSRVTGIPRVSCHPLHCAHLAKGRRAKRTRIRKLVRPGAAVLIVVAIAAGGYLWISTRAGNQRRMLDADMAQAQKAAEAGNMKLVLDLIEKHPGNPHLAGMRLMAFEKLQPTYLSAAGKHSDRELDKLINRRVQASGIIVWDLSPRKDGHLWSCIQAQMKEGDYRYLQLFFPKGAGTLGDLQKEGLVKGARVQVYGFLTKVDRHLLAKDEYGLNPIEAWETVDDP